MTNIYKFIIQSGTGMGTELLLDKGELFLGREITNELVINDPEVSRKHLHLVLDGAAYRLEDLGSTNGTFIRGQRLSGPVLLQPGEIITLGEKIVLRYEVVGSDPNATVVVQRNAPPKAQMQDTPVAPPVVMPTPPIAPPPAPPVGRVAAPSIPATPAYPPANKPNIAPPAGPKKKSKALIIILILVGIIVLFCVIPWIIIDVTDSYCSLAPRLMNIFFTNGCPI